MAPGQRDVWLHREAPTPALRDRPAGPNPGRRLHSSEYSRPLSVIPLCVGMGMRASRPPIPYPLDTRFVGQYSLKKVHDPAEFRTEPFFLDGHLCHINIYIVLCKVKKHRKDVSQNHAPPTAVAWRRHPQSQTQAHSDIFTLFFNRVFLYNHSNSFFINHHFF